MLKNVKCSNQQLHLFSLWLVFMKIFRRNNLASLIYLASPIYFPFRLIGFQVATVDMTSTLSSLSPCSECHTALSVGLFTTKLTAVRCSLSICSTQFWKEWHIVEYSTSHYAGLYYYTIISGRPYSVFNIHSLKIRHQPENLKRSQTAAHCDI
jgi:hypothetical protein